MVPRYPFQVPFERLRDDLDTFIDATFTALESDFLVLPRGESFIDYDAWNRAYEALATDTQQFSVLEVEPILRVIQREPLAFVVLRSIMGFSPPEWADVTTVETGEDLSQGFARQIDNEVRTDPTKKPARTDLRRRRIRAMIQAACNIVQEGSPDVEVDEVHRLDKIDTDGGISSLRHVATEGVPYSALLYERYLGGPFAAHRNAVSELIGGDLEDKIERELERSRVPYYRAGRAEQISGWDQTPDFFAPTTQTPIAVIEAKLTQDDGTARDKVTRVQNLDRIRTQKERSGEQAPQVIACIGGRGFGVRRADMERLLLATRGKVFTVSTVDHLVEHTRLAELRHSAST